MSTDKESSAAGTDNRPPMLVESDYDSWKIRIHRYIRGKPLGKLIWNSIQNGPSPHPMVTDAPTEGQTGVNMPRMKLDSEFTPEETNRENADTQAEIILSQGLPRHIFNILNQTNTAKEIWDNVEMLMQGSGRTLQQRKEDLFDEFERFRAIGNEPIHDYFVRFHKLVNDMKITQLEIPTHQLNTKFVNNLPSYWGKYVTNVKQNMDISTTNYVHIYTHLKAYEPHATKTLKKQEQSSSIIDPLAYMAQATPTTSLPPLSTSQPQPAVLSPNDAMMATMTQIANLLSGFQKQFPPTNNQLRSSSNSRTHATVHDGQIVTETVQRRAPGNVGNTGSRGNQSYGNVTTATGKKVICYNCRGEGHVARQCKEPKRAKDSQYFKDKMLLMEAKEKGVTLDAEAEAFLANVECTAPYDQPLAMATTNIFEVNHEDAYDSDVDEGPNAAAAFMANLSSTSGTNGATTSQVNEVHTDANQIFDNVNHLLTHEMHQEEHLDSDVESDIDDNTIPYHQYQLDSEVQDVPTEVSSAPPGEISMITILDDLRTQLDGHLKVNQEQCLVNDSLRAELAKCKLEIVRLDTQQVKLDLERQVRQEQNLVTQRNERNAELEQEKVMLKIHLKSKDVSIEFLKSENQKVLTDKKKLEDKYLDEIVCLKSANKVATDLLQKFQMPTHTIPMLSKKPKNASQDLHKDILGRSNPRYGKKAPVINASNAWDTDETLASAEVSMAKMKGKPGHVRPESGFYEKLNAMMFVPQKELSPENRCIGFLPTKLASQASTPPATPVTPPYVPKRNTLQTADDTIVKEVAEFKEIHYALEDEYKRCVLENKNLIIEKKNLLIKNDSLIVECLERDICSIVLYSDVAVTPSSNCSCDNLRLECDREHNKVLELEAEISKQKRLITESEKRFAFLEQNYVSLQLKFQNYKQCSDTSSASNAIFEINKLRDQLQGKDATIRNLDAQINIMKVLNVGSTEGSCDQQALDTDIIQLKDMITSLRIQLDGLKVENVSLKRRYDELSKANTHSRTAYTEKLSALTAEHTKLQAQVTGVKPTSGASKPVPKRAPRNHSSLPAKSANARRVEAHHRTLNKKNHVDSNLLVKHSVFVSNSNNDCGACNKSEWKPINKVGKPIKRVWNSISKNIANTKPQWKPTGRHFSLYEMHPLTRIMEPSAETLALSPSVSSSAQITMISRFPDCKFCDPQSGSKGISGCSRHMTGDRARLINFVEKFIGIVRFGNDEYAAIVGYGDYKVGDTIISRVYYLLQDSSKTYYSVDSFVGRSIEVAFATAFCHIRNYDMMDLLKVYWLPANEIASQASTPATPVTPYVPKSPPPSQVLATLHNIKAVFPQFDAIIKERTTVKPLYVSLPCYEYAKEFALQQVVPFLDYFKKHVQTADDTIVKEVAEFKEIHYALEDEYERCVLENKNLIIEKKNLLIKNDSLITECLEKDICSIVLASDIVVPPSSNCLCEELRSNCDREHSKVVELEAVILKKQQMLNESEKRCAFIEKNHVNLQVKFQKYKECLQNQMVCDNTNSTTSIENFEINKLKDQLQGKDDTIRNLQTQINITRMLNVGSTVGSFDKQALETELTQLKDMITSLRIQLDGLKVENMSLKNRYDELSKAITHSRTAYTEKLSALTAEHTKLQAQVTGKTSSGPSTSEKPKVLASGIYTNSSKTKLATESRKPMAKSHTQNHRILPSKSVNARRAADHNRKLNVVDHNQFVIHSLKSMNTKTPQAKHSVNYTKKVWKATRNHNVNTTKTAWRPTGKVVGSVKPQWKPTGRHFALYDNCPLTRIMEPIVESLELTRVLVLVPKLL
ncbi:retrovirus-related pol polyprotein from transposon TNT 1-94 [Tanacetum coccineum]